MSAPADADCTVAELEREVAKLRKINQALMGRVERSMDLPTNEFALFETTILLEGKVRERTDTLERVLEDLRRTNAALAEAKAEAERANQSKTRFLAAAGHDLLQPLNAARLFVSALAETAQGPQSRTLVDNIDAAFDALESLLGDLLDISKLDAGVLVPQVVSLPIAALLKTLAVEFAPVARQRGLTLRFVPSSATIRTDPQLLARVLRNLVSNAMRYTKRGKVLIGCRRRPDGLSIEVLDSGIGIPGDQLEEVFEEFRRLGAQDEAGERGSGLGLAIVRRITRLLGHELSVTSTPGRGSRFAVLVPRASPPVVAESAPADARPSDMLAGARILVIEDEPATREAMLALLAGWGCHAVAAGDAGAALAKLRAGSHRPDLVIADYHLGGAQRGTDAVEVIRQRCGVVVPALLLTADRSPEVQAEAQRSGLPLLNKPVRPARMRALLSHLLAVEQPAEPAEGAVEGSAATSRQRTSARPPLPGYG